VATGRQADDRDGRATCGSAPLPADCVVGAAAVLKEPRLHRGRLFWLEQLPAQRGRTTLRLRTRQGVELELTPGLDLRSRIHGYGGGSFCVDGDTAVVVAERGCSLWRLDLPGDRLDLPDDRIDAQDRELDVAAPASSVASVAAPVRLTPPAAAGEGEAGGEPSLFGDGVLDLDRRRWIGVCEQQERDRLVAVPLAGGAPRLLWESPDFCGYAVLSPSGSHLAWLSWRQPCMPWDRSQLWLGRFDQRGELVDVRPIAGSVPAEGQAISVYQPLWAGPDLVVANDRSGWWNLEALENAAQLAAAAAPQWRPLLPMQAEFAMPQWVYGLRTTAWDGRQLLAVACLQGRWQLGALVPSPIGAANIAAAPIASLSAPLSRGPSSSAPSTAAASDGSAVRPSASAAATVPTGSQAGVDLLLPSATDGGPIANEPSGAAGSQPGGIRPAGSPDRPLRWQPIPLPFDDLASLDAEAGRLVAIASGPADGPGLLELETNGSSWRHRPAAPAPLPRDAISRPQPLWFAGHRGLSSHAWYYPPRGGASASSPLLVRGHSGPTGMARTGLSLSIQFWTSRGWGVVDVNYGGSSGFGRAYRERLDGGWGVVDVDDCLAAARALVDSGRADPDRIAMEGSSASGFTVLAAMARDRTIRAGAIRYPVTDLTALAEGDHRFEARYFDGLVGPWPQARAVYEERSPLNQVERIKAPLLFFHGLDDPVVPAAQSIAMVERLRQRGVPVELQLFEGEGHGFRDGAVQRQVLERTEAFFRAQFQLPEPS